ncbi:MAG: hypothetical protein QW734_05530 [Candidatus Bathyarchaeia archaeon]
MPKSEVLTLCIYPKDCNFKKLRIIGKPRKGRTAILVVTCQFNGTCNQQRQRLIQEIACNIPKQHGTMQLQHENGKNTMQKSRENILNWKKSLYSPQNNP